MLSGPPPWETPLRDHPNNACPSANNKGADQRETMIKQIKPVTQQDLMTEAKIIKEYSNPIDKEVTNIDTLGNKQ